MEQAKANVHQCDESSAYRFAEKVSEKAGSGRVELRLPQPRLFSWELSFFVIALLVRND